jgi:hypothetical protein
MARPGLADFSNVLPASRQKLTRLTGRIKMVLPARCRQHVDRAFLVVCEDCGQRRNAIVSKRACACFERPVKTIETW